MSTPNNGGPAFPRVETAESDRIIPGMSLRDYFAGQALAGLIQSGALGHLTVELEASNEDAERIIAMSCFRFADAMLAERSKGGAS